MTDSHLPFQQLILASGNAGKLKEHQAMLGELVTVRPPSHLIPDEA